MLGPRKAAIIGSFKTSERYANVVEAIKAFRAEGWVVTSPTGSQVLEHGIDFVRFESDELQHSDAEVQTRTLVNIFSADLIFVVVRDGYIGRTTCYEIGRLIQARRPIFFSESPKDLPIAIPTEFVVPASQIAKDFRNRTPPFLFDSGADYLCELERGLLDV